MTTVPLLIHVLCISAQQFGEQMQESNPDLFDQLRSQAQAAVNQHRGQNGSEGQDPKTGQNFFMYSDLS